MDLGLFEISKGPCWRGGLDLGLFEISKGPCLRGGLDLGLFGKSNRPSGRWGWTLDFQKERIHVLQGGCYTVTFVPLNATGNGNPESNSPLACWPGGSADVYGTYV